MKSSLLLFIWDMLYFILVSIPVFLIVYSLAITAIATKHFLLKLKCLLFKPSA
jgi:hypothetical protein